MPIFENTARINCADTSGRRLVIIEQRKFPSSPPNGKPQAPIIDYMTEDGQVANKIDDDNFLLLLTDEVFHRT
jgi:hypothetical protein